MSQRITDVIVAACEELDCNYQDYAAWFSVLIDDCLKTMKTSSILDPNQKTKAEVYDNKLVLPSDVISLLFVSRSITMDPLLSPHIEYKQQGDIVIFASDLDIEDGDEVYLQYKGFKKDKDGNVMYDGRWNRMLIAYIGWKYCRRYIKEKGTVSMQSYHNEFKSQKMANL